MLLPTNLAASSTNLAGSVDVGVEASPVEVEVRCGMWGEPGEERIIVVGLPDAAVRESVDRVSTALTSSGYHLPPGKTTINLAPPGRSIVVGLPEGRAAFPRRSPARAIICRHRAGVVDGQ